MKITTKLIASFTLVIVLSGVMGFMGYRGLTAATSALDEVGAVRAPSVQGLLTAKTGLYGVRAANAALMIDSLAPDKRAVQEAFRNECMADIKGGLALYEPLPQTPDEAKIWVQFEPALRAWELAAKDVAASQLAWNTARTEGKPAEVIAAAAADANAKFSVIGAHFLTVRESLKKLVDLNVGIQDEISTTGLRAASTAQTVLIGAMVIMMVTASVLGALICFNISRAFKGLIGRVAEIQASNDLTKRVDVSSKDEIGRLGAAFNGMIQTLHTIISEVSSTTTQVAAAATEIAASSEEMAAAVGEVARQSTSAATRSDASGRLASEGGLIVQATVSGMKEIEIAVTESAASVTALGKRGEEIGMVISVINDIADQTNLLALNAAIEAARAGEHGRGFAVVADEVRKLADRTTKATEEIGESIKAIQGETHTAASRMHRGSEQVKSGVTNAEQAGASLEQIVAGTKDLASMIMSISAASEEAGAGASQSASAATELSTKAEQLRGLVERFKV